MTFRGTYRDALASCDVSNPPWDFPLENGPMRGTDATSVDLIYIYSV